MSTRPFRQGDVLLIPVKQSDIPSSAAPVAREGGRLILAYGEVTGHAHVVVAPDATLLLDPETNQRWLLTGTGAVVAHEEHDWAHLPDASAFKVRIQTEYTPEAPKQVAD